MDYLTLFLLLPPHAFLNCNIQDACKVFTIYIMKKHNWLGINETGKLIMPESTLKYMEDEKIKRDEMALNPSKSRGHHGTHVEKTATV
jgi:hypothetical protein